MHCFSHVLHLSFILPSINILFHYIHAFLWIFCDPLIIFIFLKWSVLASCTLCQSWKKGGEIVEICGFFLKIIYIRGRNTCLCKGEMCFILLGECLPPSSCTPVLWPCLHTLYLSLIYLWWCMYSSPTFTYVVSFLSLYTCFLFLYAIYYFCFTQRCLDEFYLKCFSNTGCQSLLVIKSLLAKFFKSLC